MAEWKHFIVDNKEFNNLKKYGTPIEVSSDIFYCNCGVELYSKDGQMLNAIYDANLKVIRKINDYNPIYNKSPNRDIAIFNDYLINDNINTIIVDGIFGTGKTSTLCSHIVPKICKALRGEENLKKIYISKPHEKLGKSYGHLPGDLQDKVNHEFMSYYQYFDRFGQPGLALKLIEEGILELVVFEYLRGRDFDDGWVVLDEAQNTNKKEIISFLSRVGDKAKLVILGDSSNYQIDKRGNNEKENGLTFLKNLFINKKYTGYVEMKSTSHVLRGQRVKDMYLFMKEG